MGLERLIGPYGTYSMIAEVLLFVMVSYRHVQRKKSFYLQGIGSLALGLGLTVLIEAMADVANQHTSLPAYLSLAGALAAVMLCYRLPLLKALYIMGVGYTAQYVMYTLWLGACMCFVPGFVYYQESSLILGFYVAALLVVGLVLWHTMRIHRYMAQMKRFNTAVVLSFLLIILAAVTLTYRANTQNDLTTILYARISASIICVLGVIYASLSLIYQQVKIDKALQSYMLARQKVEFNMVQKNTEALNIKCHDLKYQMRALRGKLKEGSEAELQEIETTIDQFQCSYDTGCESLDIVLSEKARLCSQQKIAFTFMGDGRLLQEMSDVDIYRLFCNALDNAMEAVAYVPPEQRIIGTSIQREGPFAAIHIDNYCDGLMPLIDGLPQTRKEDEENHGFGLRSIKAIAEQYQGIFRVNCQEQIFSLDVLIPLND